MEEKEIAETEEETKEEQQKESVKTENVIALCMAIIAVIVIGALIVLVTISVFTRVNHAPRTDDVIPEESDEEEPEPEVEPEKKEEKPKSLPDRVDIQSAIDSWASSTAGTRAAIVYDLDRDEIVGEFDSERYFNMASLFKLFVVYEGYQRIASGEWDAEDIAGYTGLTVLECLDLSIRESDSICAETIWAMIGRDELDEIVEEDYGISGTTVTSIASNPHDIMEIMKLFYEHKNIKDGDLLERMKDSFLNQPITEYDWRQGLPAGFSGEAKVYNKSGWDYDDEEEKWNCYNDAAIIETESGRHFIAVLMTSESSLYRIQQFGAMLEEELP